VNIIVAESSRQIAEDSRKESHIMKQIAEDTRRDSSSMKTISFMALIFLPGTFVAVRYST